MQTFSKKTLVATAAIALFGLGAASTAQAANADTEAFSLTRVSSFIWTNTTLGRQVAAGDFAVPPSVITNQASNSAGLTPGGSATHSVPSTQGAIAAFQSCVGKTGEGTGDCVGLSPSNWLQQSTKYLAKGANSLAGAIIVPGGASANGLADTQLDGITSSGNGNAQVGTSSNFQFILGVGGVFQFDFDALLDVTAQIKDSAQAGTATATSNYEVKITQPGAAVPLIFDWLPGTTVSGGTETLTPIGGGLCGTLNNSATANAPADFDQTNLNCHYSASGIALAAGVLYKLTIDQKNASNADQTVQTVPEPATLALMGFGLLGVAGVARRRTKA